MNEIRYKPIGTIHSPFKEPHDTPIQPAFAKEAEGTVEIFPEYAEGLTDLEGFSHIILLYHFHLSKEFSLMVKPYLDDRFHGLFATRAPARPNPIGVSVVSLINVKRGELFVQGIDIIDGTPLLDIKPYVPEFNMQKAVKIGWLESKLNKRK